VLYKTISTVAEKFRGGERAPELIQWAKNEIISAGFSHLDYIEIRDAEDLKPVYDASRPARVLAAAWLGKPRLIDNVAV